MDDPQADSMEGGAAPEFAHADWRRGDPRYGEQCADTDGMAKAGSEGWLGWSPVPNRIAQLEAEVAALKAQLAASTSITAFMDDQPQGKPPIPARALRFGAQRIGLYLP